MINLLLKTFVKEENMSSPAARKRVGVLGSCAAIGVNLLLFGLKFFIGVLTKSVSVTADAVNNLSDTGSALVTLIGFKMADKQADEKHPFGHGRIEYISALIVSFLILLAGLELAKGSVSRIITPEPVAFSLPMIAALFLTMPVKLWLSRVTGRLGKLAGSVAMAATSADSLNDVFVTLATIISALISKYTGLYIIDGCVGILAALFVLYSGFCIAKDSLDPLLGQKPDSELVSKIEKIILESEYVCGMHDLIIHNYGPGRFIAGVHAEVPCDVDMLKIHDIIDLAERRISAELGVMISIHLDPLETDDEKTNALRAMMDKILSQIDTRLTFHDFRIVSGETHTNLIFDVTVPPGFGLSDEQIKAAIDSRLEETYFTVIVFDRSFV